MPRSSSQILIRVVLGLALVAVLASAGALWWLSRPSRAERLVRHAIGILLAHEAKAPDDRVEAAVFEFYRRHGTRAAWSDGRRASDEALAVVHLLAQAGREGLDPAAYADSSLIREVEALHSPRLAGLLTDPERLAALDLRLTRNFLRYASDIHDGRLPSVALDPDWVAARDTVVLEEVLRRALASHRAAQALADLVPRGEQYRQLRGALATYRELADRGGWPGFPDGPALKRGARGRRVALLRERLALEGYDVTTGDSQKFDLELHRAVRAFQRRNGLHPAGRVGEDTRAALNVTAEERVRQIELNLERQRWMPQSLPEPHIIVSLTDFSLGLRDSGRTVLRSRVVVGEPRNPTPMFSAALSFMVINPTWRLPKRILVEEILPELERDTTYLTQHEMRVMFTQAPRLTEVPHDTVDWTAVEEDTFPYLVVQDPGDENPLGRIKFMCPNEHDVYLHDTPMKHYFSESARAYSHGCVRVQGARELADWLIARDTLLELEERPSRRRARSPDLRDSLAAAIDSLATRRLRLREKVPVHFVYWTAWVDSSGAAHFRKDLYDIDTRLDEALRSGRAAEFVLNPELEWGEKHRKEPLLSPDGQ
jgi:murein L,D-transpeptidase YcbB/YkuD